MRITQNLDNPTYEPSNRLLVRHGSIIIAHSRVIDREIQFGDQRRGGTGEGPNAAVSSTRAQFFAPRGIGWSDGQARFWLVNAFKQELTVDGNLDPRLQHSLFYPDLFEDFGDKTYSRDWE